MRNCPRCDRELTTENIYQNCCNDTDFYVCCLSCGLHSPSETSRQAVLDNWGKWATELYEYWEAFRFDKVSRNQIIQFLDTVPLGYRTETEHLFSLDLMNRIQKAIAGMPCDWKPSND